MLKYWLKYDQHAILKNKKKFKNYPFNFSGTFSYDENMPADQNDVVANPVLTEEIDKLPETLYLITKYRNELIVDFLNFKYGFIVSEKMFNLFDKYAKGDFYHSRLFVIGQKKKRLSNRPMYYVRFFNRADILDFDKMDIDGKYYKSIDSKNRIDENGSVICSSIIFVRENLVGELIFSADVPFGFSPLFCSQKFRDDCAAIDIKGAFFIPLDELLVVDFIPHDQSMYKQAKPRLIDTKTLEYWGGDANRENFFRYDQARLDALKRKLSKRIKIS